ncbi:FtsB family cell division protein [Aquibaculum arenosum]|uniref:Septum formation initiator family protein n=1 Tax=Aquibaculum arenosum TaxID=3032591 RepID=A0ABT5YP66_9PROT|nr:septum formation initiator family protein [Fodinicurvata sp. CAU 1616]MDF2096755.1 septum formation initiator family protein [Fodinicurvata sp. CAU 1616]
MRLLTDIRQTLGHVAPQALAIAAVAYFAFHAVQGERGLLAYKRLNEELTQTRSLAAEVADQRETWERRVSLLRPESLDPDLLEERARLLLNYLREDEAVIYLPEQNLDNQ